MLSPAELYRFTANLACVRCHEVLRPGDPVDATLCDDCWRELAAEDDGLDAVREYAEREATLAMIEAAELRATEAAMADHAGRAADGERGVFGDSEIHFWALTYLTHHEETPIIPAWKRQKHSWKPSAILAV